MIQAEPIQYNNQYNSRTGSRRHPRLDNKSSGYVAQPCLLGLLICSISSLPSLDSTARERFTMSVV